MPHDSITLAVAAGNIGDDTVLEAQLHAKKAGLTKLWRADSFGWSLIKMCLECSMLISHIAYLSCCLIYGEGYDQFMAVYIFALVPMCLTCFSMVIDYMDEEDLRAIPNCPKDACFVTRFFTTRVGSTTNLITGALCFLDSTRYGGFGVLMSLFNAKNELVMLRAIGTIWFFTAAVVLFIGAVLNRSAMIGYALQRLTRPELEDLFKNEDAWTLFKIYLQRFDRFYFFFSAFLTLAYAGLWYHLETNFTFAAWTTIILYFILLPGMIWAVGSSVGPLSKKLVYYVLQTEDDVPEDDTDDEEAGMIKNSTSSAAKRAQDAAENE